MSKRKKRKLRVNGGDKIKHKDSPAASGNVMATTWALATSRTSTTENATLGSIGSLPDISLLMASMLVPPCCVRTGPRMNAGFITAISNLSSSRKVRPKLKKIMKKLHYIQRGGS